MDRIIELGQDIVKLWDVYSGFYLDGILNTLILALVATLFGCIIGLICGVLNTIPYAPNDSIVKKVFLKLIRGLVRAYVEIFRGTPMVLQAVFIYYGLPYFTHNQVALAPSVWPGSMEIMPPRTDSAM